nr:T9SS type A sorting domain-containing protein [Chitinophagaceae bacterium]
GHAAMWVHQQLVLAGQEGFVYSADGVHLQYFSGRFADAATNGQHIVAVGSLNTAGQIFSSANQTDWQDRSVPMLREMHTVLHCNGRFVAAGNQQVLQSTDNGASWQSLSEPPYIFFRMQQAAGSFVAFARSVGGTDYLLYSANGIEWQEAATVTDVQFYRLRYVGGHWLAMGFHTQEERGEIWQSADGLHWQVITPALSRPIHSFQDVMFDGWRFHFAAVGTRSEGSTAPGAFCTVVTAQLLQPDSFRVVGAVQAQENPGMPGVWEGQASFAWSDGYWVGTASDLQDDNYASYVLYSSDGVSWQAAALGHSHTATSMLSFGHHFVALGGTHSLAKIVFDASGLPAVTTGQPERVFSTGATVRQSIVSAGAVVLRTGVVVATHARPGLSDLQVAAGTSLQFDVHITGLQNNQQYFSRAFAVTAGGVAYGQVSSFTTACNALVEGSLSENEDEAVINVTPGQAQPAAMGCRSMASIRPWGTSPVSGTVAAKAWVRASLFESNGQLLVGRAFQLQPAQHAATATAIVTLYFSQTDFDEFNAAHSVGYLPAAPADGVGKSNLRIYKFGGTSTDGSGEPGSFASSATVIDPADDSILWNAGLQRWEVSFPVVGFSGFFAGQAQQQVLPLQLIQWNASRQGAAALLRWQVAGAERLANTFEVQRSTDGRQFERIAQVANRGAGTYRWTDAAAPAGTVWYRLMWHTASGQHLSAVVVLGGASYPVGWQLGPNPANGSLWVQGPAAAANYQVVGADGRVYQSGRWQAGQSLDVSRLSTGIYRLVLSAAGQVKSIPFSKQ